MNSTEANETGNAVTGEYDSMDWAVIPDTTEDCNGNAMLVYVCSVCEFQHAQCLEVHYHLQRRHGQLLEKVRRCKEEGVGRDEEILELLRRNSVRGEKSGRKKELEKDRNERESRQELGTKRRITRDTSASPRKMVRAVENVPIRPLTELSTKLSEEFNKFSSEVSTRKSTHRKEAILLLAGTLSWTEARMAKVAQFLGMTSSNWKSKLTSFILDKFVGLSESTDPAVLRILGSASELAESVEKTNTEYLGLANRPVRKVVAKGERTSAFFHVRDTFGLYHNYRVGVAAFIWFGSSHFCKSVGLPPNTFGLSYSPALES